MKVWITKYALSKCIFEAEANIFANRRMIVYRCPKAPYSGYAHGEGRDWHRTEASARERAEQMRIAKIASLRKSIAKLEKLRF